jgi:hypothetical protein
MLRSERSLYSILVYAHVVVSFHLSNLRIVQAIVYLTMTTLFFGLFFGFRRIAQRTGRVTEGGRSPLRDRGPRWVAQGTVS